MKQLVLLDPVALLKENVMLKAALKTIAFQRIGVSHEIAEKALSEAQDWGRDA